MCGIVGVTFFDPERQPSAGILHEMNERIRPRGPDSGGVFVSGHVGLGMRRLQVIDIEGGEQPMTSPDGRCTIVFNGEIYNTPELRRELKNEGYHFRSSSDTEVILAAWQHYGDSCVSFLRGMFAFAIWDENRKVLFLARDRIGKKPLYYYRDREKIVFASEIKAILSHPGLQLSVDLNAVNEFLHNGCIPAGQSIFGQIRKLEKGHTLSIRPDGECRFDQYWQVPLPTPVERSESDWLAELKDVLEDAVSCRLMSDVPLGAFLSGGIDSTAIVGLMTQMSSRPVKTFSVGFGETTFDESQYARMAAQHFGTEHTSQKMDIEWCSAVENSIDSFDEPFADSSSIPTWLLSKFTREHVTVALSGDGADELFGGYGRYTGMRIVQKFQRLPVPLQKFIEASAHRLLPRNDLYIAASLSKQIRQGFTLTSRLRHSPGDVAPVYCDYEMRGRLLRGIDFEKGWVEKTAESYGDLDPVSRMMWTDLNGYLVDDILVKVDRMSMANSLEVRCPFLDHKLIEFAATMPLDMKVRGKQTKHILREFSKGWMPPDLLKRQKHGFSIPLAKVLRTDLRPLVRQHLIDEFHFGWLDQTEVRKIAQSHLDESADLAQPVWSLLNLSMWWNNYRGHVNL